MANTVGLSRRHHKDPETWPLSLSPWAQSAAPTGIDDCDIPTSRCVERFLARRAGSAMGHIIGMAGHLEENLERIEPIPWSVVRAAQLAA